MLALRRLLVALVVTAGPLSAQAPSLTELWRVVASTLTVPAALARGPGAAFWNPAAAAPGTARLRAGIEVIETPDVLALDGLLATLHWRVAGRLVAGVQLGRIAVSDLARTTTSPLTQPGEIPVHSQLLGLGVAWSAGPVALGLLARGHETRLDARAERGITADVGMRWRVAPGLVLAGSTRFLRPLLRRDPVTTLDIGAEATVPIAPVWGSVAQVVFTLGAGRHGDDPPEWTGGAALAVADRLRVGWSLGHERAYGAGGWRSAIGIEFRAGPYTVLVARGDGLNGLGGTYRLGLGVSGT